MLLDGDTKARARPISGLPASITRTDHSSGIWGYRRQGFGVFHAEGARSRDRRGYLPTSVENTGGGGVWAPDGKSFFYSALDENHRPSKVFHHISARRSREDRLVYEEEDAGFFMGVGGSLLDDYIFIDIHDHETIGIPAAVDQGPDGRAEAGRGRARPASNMR